MNTELIIQDYFGASYFLEANSNKELVVFVVDDNKLYLNLLMNVIKKPNITVHAFELGETCLKCLDLKPDLVILDYHLNSVLRTAMKGDKVAEIIHEEKPDTEIILISSDQKFKLFVDLRIAKANNIRYKDKSSLRYLRRLVLNMWKRKLVHLKYRKSIFKLGLGFVIFALFIVIVKLLII